MNTHSGGQSPAIRIRIDSPIAKEIAWAWTVFARDTSIRWELVEDRTRPIDLLISEDPGADIVLSMHFRDCYINGTYRFNAFMESEPLIYSESGHPDFLSTAFYLINSVQEYSAEGLDRYGRFPYEQSLQYHYGCVEKNLVSAYFRTLYQSVEILRNSGPLISAPSRLFLSHDIDFLHASWKEDGKAVLRKGRIDQFVSLLSRKGSEKEDWFNMEELMSVNARYDFPATFFWIPVQEEGRNDPPDADYSIADPRVEAIIKKVHQSEGFESGLHRSAHGTLAAELQMLPCKVRTNRNHFLRFHLPDHYERVAASGIQLDASLGFAEHHGFRNSYGKPFAPWSAAQRKTLSFVEVPLHMMDATYEHYLKTGPDGLMESCSEFLEQNQNDCVLSLLWHNNYFSKHAYGEYRKVYLELLPLIRSLGIRGISNDTILRQYLG